MVARIWLAGVVAMAFMAAVASAPAAVDAVGCPGIPSGPRGTATATPTAALAAHVPLGVDFMPLADAVVEELPPPPALMLLERLRFEPDGEIPSRPAEGPLLFYVETGHVTIFRAGDEERLAPGSSALVQTDQSYSIVNVARGPASVLKLAVVVKSTPDEQVMDRVDFPTVQITSAPRPAPTRLFRAEIEFVPAAGRMFIGCASWAMRSAAAAPHRHPGAIGVRMIAGRLQIDDGASLRMLPTDGCTLLEYRERYLIRAGDEPPIALLVGVIPVGQDLWLPAGDEPLQQGPRTHRADVDCGPSM